MIVVIEGISACGKSSWCSSHAVGQVVAENGRIDGPDRAQAPAEAAAFWARRNQDRWQAAIAMDRSTGLAICDTDPLKLHYIWCLWKIGEAREADWRLELAATRETFAHKQIGFADLYYIGVIEPAVARQRKQADSTRSRRNFELHVRLQPALIAWYEALSAVLPGQVFFGFPDARPVTAPMAAQPSLGDMTWPPLTTSLLVSQALLPRRLFGRNGDLVERGIFAGQRRSAGRKLVEGKNIGHRQRCLGVAQAAGMVRRHRRVRAGEERGPLKASLGPPGPRQ